MTPANPVETVGDNAAVWTNAGRRTRGALVIVMGCLAMIAPIFAGPLAITLVGLLLIVCGALEMFETFRLPDESSQRSAYLSGVLSILVGILLLNNPKIVFGGLGLFFGGSFLIDGINKVIAAWRARTRESYSHWTFVAAVVNVCLGLVLITGWPFSGVRIIAVLVGIRMLTAGWAMMLGREKPAPVIAVVEGHPDRRLNLPAHAEFARLNDVLDTEEKSRRAIDAYWCWMFIVLFFAIHIGRMNVEWNLVGLTAPLFAVLGDVATSVIFAFGMILPSRLAWRKLTRMPERHGWKNALARIDHGQSPGLTGRVYQAWLTHRLRFSRRFARMCHSPWAALRWGMQVGLPATAILIAVNPIWGLNWFFNSEAWTTGLWNRWAEARTDTWRENMIEAVGITYRDKNIPADRLFDLSPEGVNGRDDFSFLVLGDTGEGGTAQHSLRDQYLSLGQRPDVKFLVISSDVIYPDGAMSDYEPKFYLPFKGFTKPIYAIPGNHDWYDALEAFAANFLEPDAARASMLSRVKTDGHLTTTTEGRIDRYIQQAARLRQDYGVSNGFQRGPFFEVQTDRFALIAVDTGVLKSVNSTQWTWLKDSLERARGKSIMAILGHPLYAGGRYQGGTDAPIAGEWIGDGIEPFIAIHRLLKDHNVEIVMAGDTHYFEHYVEKYESSGSSRTMQHFVNGGGGAYISIGTPLDWPRQPAVPDCAFFPRTDVVTAKLDRDTPNWKMPLWLWAKHFRAWPATVETTAAAFDYSRTPFFQSFVEVRVEGSANRVRLIPHGANGPLRWKEFQTFGAVVPAGKANDDFVEFVITMPSRQ